MARTRIPCVPTFKYPFSLANKRDYEGGWSREVTVRELPVSKSMAGVNMRLTAGGVRELHWHTAGEWAIMLYGKARIGLPEAWLSSAVRGASSPSLQIPIFDERFAGRSAHPRTSVRHSVEGSTPKWPFSSGENLAKRFRIFLSRCTSLSSTQRKFCRPDGNQYAEQMSADQFRTNI